MTYSPDTIQGVLDFCEREGQPSESVKQLRALVVEAYDFPDGHPSNKWRRKAEQLDAWPKPKPGGLLLHPRDD